MSEQSSHLMKVYSGKVELGTCGVETSLVDCAGNVLRVGDIVASFTEDEFGVNNFNGLTVVVEDRPALTGRTENEGPFVMGIKNVDFMHEDSKWHVRRLKAWEDVIDGEHWKDFGFSFRKEQP